MSDREAILMERIEVLEDEVRVLKAVNKDVDSGLDQLREAGMNADRKLMETSRLFAYLLVTRHNGEAEFQAHSLENWADQMDSRVVVVMEKDPSLGVYRAKAVTRGEAGQIAQR